MSEVKWTNEQKQAIYEKGQNILVAAAAGSRKNGSTSRKNNKQNNKRKNRHKQNSSRNIYKSCSSRNENKNTRRNIQKNRRRSRRQTFAKTNNTTCKSKHKHNRRFLPRRR